MYLLYGEYLCTRVDGGRGGRGVDAIQRRHIGQFRVIDFAAVCSGSYLPGVRRENTYTGILTRRSLSVFVAAVR